MGPEPLPPDVGTDDADEVAEPEAKGPEILPPLGRTTGAVTQSFSSSTTFRSVSSLGAGGHVDSEIEFDLPQSAVDPDGRLTAQQYADLMQAWADAIERDVEDAGDVRPDAMLQAAQRIPLPLSGIGPHGLSAAEQEAMTRRAQQTVAGMLSIPSLGDLTTSGVLPADLAEQIRAAPPSSGRPKRRGITVSCGVVALLGAAATVGMVVALWR